jgi:hypothetical protein
MTDPYCPAVATAAPNDAPFIVKSSDEFPAGDEDWVQVMGKREKT